MADEKTKTVSAADFEVLQAKLAALETAIAEQPNYGTVGAEAVSTAKAEAKPALSGEAFAVGGDKYKVRYPIIVLDGKQIGEKDILGDKNLQKRIVDKHPGLLVKLTSMLLFLFAFSAAQATTVTINANTAEVVTTSFKKREFYNVQDMLIIYYATTEAFEMQVAETRSKVFGGDIDSVTITGASTAAAKLAFLRTILLEATTTNGYRVFMGRSNLEFYYAAATNRIDVKYGRNKQPLWFGHIDSLKANGTSTTLAYLRAINRYKAQDCIPSTNVATIAAGAAAGTSPTVTVTGDAYSGSISVTTGTSATTGTLATVTLKITAPTGTRVTLNPTNNNSIAHVVRTRGTGTTTTLVLTVPTTALSDATAYTWDYTVVPY